MVALATIRTCSPALVTAGNATEYPPGTLTDSPLVVCTSDAVLSPPRPPWSDLCVVERMTLEPSTRELSKSSLEVMRKDETIPAVVKVRPIPFDSDLAAQKGAAFVVCTNGLPSTRTPFAQYSAGMTCESRTALTLLFQARDRPCAPLISW